MTLILRIITMWYAVGAVATVITVVAAMRSRADYYIGYPEEEPEVTVQKPKPSPPSPPPATLITPNPVKVKVGSILYARLSGGGPGIISVNGEKRFSNAIVEHGGKMLFLTMELAEEMQDDYISLKENETFTDSEITGINEFLESLKQGNGIDFY